MEMEILDGWDGRFLLVSDNTKTNKTRKNGV